MLFLWWDARDVKFARIDGMVALFFESADHVNHSCEDEVLNLIFSADILGWIAQLLFELCHSTNRVNACIFE